MTYVINEAHFPPFVKFYTAQNETLFAVQTFLSVRAKGPVDSTMC